MTGQTTRRDFLKHTGAAALTAGFAANYGMAAPHGVSHEMVSGKEWRQMKRNYGISLAGWSLHRTIGEGEGKRPMLDMPHMAREDFGIEAIELVNRMLASTDEAYLDQLLTNCAAHDVKILLIMIDGEGNIGAEAEDQRTSAVENHKKWMDIANYLGCHSIRMNWGGAPQNAMDDSGALETFIERSVPGFTELCEYGVEKNLFVTIENHGGPSSYPDPMDKLMAAVDHPRFGTLPDFGNFPRDENGDYTIDIYDAIDRLMGHAKALSAKCYDFDESGAHIGIDFERMIQICHDRHGYHGYIGIEYEGDRLSEPEGILAAKKLLENLRQA